MWVFCSCGFFSAVEHRCDSSLVMIRARFDGDLEKLLKKYDIKADVLKTACADYPFRVTISKDQWANAVKSEAESIDYDNFKSSVHEGTARDTAYLRCWSALRQAQS